MMKADVLSGLDKIKICTDYMLNGKKINYLPFEDNSKLEPVYTEINGWKEDISKIQNLSEAPKELHEYIDFLEEKLNIPIKIVSVGPNRNQTFIK